MYIGAGASAAILYASKYHDVKTIVNLSGTHDLKVGLVSRYGKEILERIRKEGFVELKEAPGNLSLNQPFISVLILMQRCASKR